MIERCPKTVLCLLLAALEINVSHVAATQLPNLIEVLNRLAHLQLRTELITYWRQIMFSLLRPSGEGRLTPHRSEPRAAALAIYRYVATACGHLQNFG